MTGIIIKEALPGDAAKLLEYANQIGKESDNLTYGAEGLTVSLEQEMEFLKKNAEERHSVFYLAWKNDKIIGAANLNGLSRRMSHRAGLGISVLKAEWSKGIGSMLMQKLIDYANANGIEIINLEVRSDNKAAIHLYQKFGFQTIGTSPAFFKIGAEYVDFDLMYLDLREGIKQ
ncbi:GNAT family N-acetyltransferase [Clostridiales bacterium COT073_COT-073]|nr:GNAT family N-acetyltransferase [Clostridiales bacterium COT073_COT-073]